MDVCLGKDHNSRVASRKDKAKGWMSILSALEVCVRTQVGRETRDSAFWFRYISLTIYPCVYCATFLINKYQ